jgi:hypothetical protein
LPLNGFEALVERRKRINEVIAAWVRPASFLKTAFALTLPEVPAVDAADEPALDLLQ